MAENVKVDLDTKYRDLVRREDEACQALEDHEAQLKIIEELQQRVERLENQRRHLSPINERYEALLQRERAAQLRVMAIDDGQKKRSGRAFYRSERKVVYDTDGVIAAEVDASYAVLLLRPRVDDRIRTIHINAIIDEEGVRTHMHSEFKDPQPPRQPFKLKVDQPRNQPETVRVSPEEDRDKVTTSEAGAERSRKRKSTGKNQTPKILKNEKVDLSIRVLSKRRAFQAATERLKQKVVSDSDDDEEEMTGKAEINKSRQMKSSDQDLPGKLKPTAQEQSAPTAFPRKEMSSRGSEPPLVAELATAGNKDDEEASQSETEEDQPSDDPEGESQSSSDESNGSKMK